MSLAKRSIESALYNVGSHGFQVVILFGRSILLARLLSPEIFGIYAFARAIIMITRILPAFGLGAAYMHHAPESDHKDAPAVYLTLILGFTLIWAVLLISGIKLFTEYQQYWVLWVLVIVTFISNFVAPSQTILAKQVSFQRPALLGGISAVITTPVSLFLAWNGAGIWSLLCIDIINATILVVGFYIIKPVWRPRLAWSQPIVRYFLRFGRKMMQAGILVQLLDRFDDLWVGYYLGNTDLGYYSRAYTFANYPRRVLASPINAVALSTYSEAKNSHKRLSQAFFLTNAFIIRVSFLFAGILFLISPEFVTLLLGETWLPMLNVFRVMLIYTMLDPIKYTVGHLYIAVGQPNALVHIRTIQFVILAIGLFTLGFRFGIVGVALSTTITVAAGTFILLVKAKKYADFSIFRLFALPIIGLLTSGIITYSLIYALDIRSGYWVTGITKLVTFTLTYCIILLLGERRQFIDMIHLVQRLLKQKYSNSIQDNIGMKPK